MEDILFSIKKEIENFNSKFPINGLQYVSKFITKLEHDDLINLIDKENWNSDLKRRVQHYGYKYDYKFRKIDKSMKVKDPPDWIHKISEKLVEKKIFSEIPDQIIINEYLPGQGISNHIDCQPCFNDTIVSLSLGSNCVMNLTSKNRIVPLLLEKNSLIILKGEARYNWMHGIKMVKTDNYFNQKIPRSRRVSLTFRKVILG